MDRVSTDRFGQFCPEFPSRWSDLGACGKKTGSDGDVAGVCDSDVAGACDSDVAGVKGVEEFIRLQLWGVKRFKIRKRYLVPDDVLGVSSTRCWRLPCIRPIDFAW